MIIIMDGEQSELSQRRCTMLHLTKIGHLTITNDQLIMTSKAIFNGIDTVIVRVSDVEQAKRWYHERLGLSVIWEDIQNKLVVLNTGGPTSLTIWQTDNIVNVNRDTASYPIFTTYDSNAAHSELKKRGVDVSGLIDDGVVKYFQFFDIDGNVLEVCEVNG